MTPSILIFAGSARRDSLNKKLARQAATVAHRSGARATFIDLRDYPMPLYDGDYERQSGVPWAAQELARLIREHDAMIIASPEYNGAFTPLLKNAIDWVSRVDVRLLANQPLGLMSASPGKGGGRRGLELARLWLRNMRVPVLDVQYTLPEAMRRLAEDRLPPAEQAELERFVKQVLEAVRQRQLAIA